MLFHEVYSVYYTAVAKLIDRAITRELNEKNATTIIQQTAFNESFFYILEQIKTQQWKLITRDYITPIKNKTQMPLTTLQKRFIKTIAQDPRFQLFCDLDISMFPELTDLEPLYTDQDFHLFDKIKNGDPYTDSLYIKNFKTILRSIKENKRIYLVFRSGKGNICTGFYTPQKLEYSEKDDKFRLICREKQCAIINIARIKSCQLKNQFSKQLLEEYSRLKRNVTIQITPERNAVERCLLHFAHFEKETKQLDRNTYEMRLSYYQDDETEVLIRVLSFGPMIKVIEPQSFIIQIKERLQKQKAVN